MELEHDKVCEDGWYEEVEHAIAKGVIEQGKARHSGIDVSPCRYTVMTRLLYANARSRNSVGLKSTLPRHQHIAELCSGSAASSVEPILGQAVVHNVASALVLDLHGLERVTASNRPKCLTSNCRNELQEYSYDYRHQETCSKADHGQGHAHGFRDLVLILRK